ncbi:hypothetical protein CPT_Maestro_159 [Acinetobacter phage Maestro]|nr:hypothetical protein CPT_Maestro_159 [Acinetobacter phage Maestro]
MQFRPFPPNYFLNSNQVGCYETLDLSQMYR